MTSYDLWLWPWILCLSFAVMGGRLTPIYAKAPSSRRKALRRHPAPLRWRRISICKTGLKNWNWLWWFESFTRLTVSAVRLCFPHKIQISTFMQTVPYCLMHSVPAARHVLVIRVGNLVSRVQQVICEQSPLYFCTYTCNNERISIPTLSVCIQADGDQK